MQQVYLIVHDRFKHECFRFLDSVRTESPEDAQFILFVIPSTRVGLAFLLSHELYKKYPKKCRMLSSEDKPIRLLPGIFCAHGFPYWQAEARRFESVESPETRSYLASFLGGSTSLLRKRLYQLELGPRILIEDTSSYHHWNPNQKHWDQRQQHYNQVVKDSWFVLCPRGACHNSYRIYEAMQCSRPPVIIDDKWAPPAGLPWDQFSVRIRERDISKIGTILGRYEHKVADMGKCARDVWENKLSHQRMPYYLLETLASDANARIPSVLEQKLKLSVANSREATRKFTRNAVVGILQKTPLSHKLHLNRS